MIEMEPDEPNNYYALAKIYENAGNYEEAEKMLIAARDRRPKDATTYMQLAAFYNSQGQFDKTIEALEARAAAEPNNPEAYYTIATYLWDKTFRDFRLKEPEKRAYLDKGVAATNKAIAIKGDYLEAIVYKGLLLRLQANMEKDRTKQQALLKEADALRDRAKALQKAKQAGAGRLVTSYERRATSDERLRGFPRIRADQRAVRPSGRAARFVWRLAENGELSSLGLVPHSAPSTRHPHCLVQDQIPVFVRGVHFGGFELQVDDLKGGVELVLGGHHEAVDGLHDLRVELEDAVARDHVRGALGLRQGLVEDDLPAGAVHGDGRGGTEPRKRAGVFDEDELSRLGHENQGKNEIGHPA